MKAKRIVARMQSDSVEPYSRWGQCIPVVLESNHPKFKVGCRLDWGFVQVALDGGYEVDVLPHEKT